MVNRVLKCVAVGILLLAPASAYAGFGDPTPSAIGIAPRDDSADSGATQLPSVTGRAFVGTLRLGRREFRIERQDDIQDRYERSYNADILWRRLEESAHKPNTITIT